MQKTKSVVLIILDGWGLSPAWGGNATVLKKPTNINRLWREYPHKVLQAFTMIAGKFGIVSDSRLGHSTIAAGRRIPQNLEIISSAIADHTFFKNKILKEAFAHSKKYNSKVHLVGLLSNGGIHSHLSHIEALLDMAARENFKEVYLDLFSDGTDSGEFDGLIFAAELQKKISRLNLGKFASLSGRLYAMDRIRDYKKTLKAYQALVFGTGFTAPNFSGAFSSAYRRGENDFNLSPTLIENEEGKTVISQNDALIFFNFRDDRIYQLAQFFADPNFRLGFTKPKIPENLFLCSLVPYDDNLQLKVAFPKTQIKHSLGEVLAFYHKEQLRVAEQEKSTHVTSFFDCGNSVFPKEEVKIVPSGKNIDLVRRPEMSAEKITREVIKAIKSKKYDFILANFANVDALAHTGSINATAKAVKIIDDDVARIIKENLYVGATIITADHGNAEQIVKLNLNRDPEMKHTLNPVPFILISPHLRKNLLEGASTASTTTLSKIITAKDTIADIAPTILELLDLPKPAEMTGHSLLSNLE